MSKSADPVYVRKYREAVRRSSWVQMPDGRAFMIMWRLYEQFGVRHLETGEQYSLPFEQAIDLGVMPLILCPVDIDAIDLG